LGFHALLREGYFQGLCANFDDRPQQIFEELMLVMAYLFVCQPCPLATEEYISQVIKNSQSVVFLPPIPNNAMGILKKHNDDTLLVYKTNVQTFLTQHPQPAQNTLPLTGVRVGSGNDLAKYQFGVLDSSIHSGLMNFSLPVPKVRSAFVVLSGHGDEFDGISDLCRKVRSGVFLEESVVLYLPISSINMSTPLNVYLFDFSSMVVSRHSHRRMESVAVMCGFISTTFR
jgi:hypothetical protein